MGETEYVYVIGCAQNSLVKIGRSIDVPKRLAGIQRMSPVMLELLWTTEGGWELESKLHRIFYVRRSHGEWFDFSGCDPVQMVQRAIEGEWMGQEFVDSDYRPGDQVLLLRGPRTVRKPRQVTSFRKASSSLDVLCVEVALMVRD